MLNTDLIGKSQNIVHGELLERNVYWTHNLSLLTCLHKKKTFFPRDWPLTPKEQKLWNNKVTHHKGKQEQGAHLWNSAVCSKQKMSLKHLTVWQTSKSRKQDWQKTKWKKWASSRVSCLRISQSGWGTGKKANHRGCTWSYYSYSAAQHILAL